MSLFKITGPGSKLSLRLEHPIHLQDDKNYFLGLLGFYGKNYVENIPELTQVEFRGGKDDEACILYIRRGSYTLEKIESLFMDFIRSNYPNLEDFANNNIEGDDVKDSSYYIRINESTDRIEFKLPVDVNLFPSFTNQRQNLGYMFGFAPSRINTPSYFMANVRYEAKSYPRLDPFQVIEIHCNLVKPAVTNHQDDPHSHQEEDILYMFYPKNEQIKLGSTIAERPVQVSYLPVNKSVKSLQKIELELKNESGYEIGFSGGSHLTVYLQLVEKNAKT